MNLECKEPIRIQCKKCGYSWYYTGKSYRAQCKKCNTWNRTGLPTKWELKNGGEKTPVNEEKTPPHDKYIAGMEKIKKLEDKVRDLNDKDKEFAVELKNQQDVYVNLQGVLSVKEGELQDAHEENKDLKDTMDELKDKQSNNLSIIQTQCNDFRARYNNLKEHINNECIRVDIIKTLYQISWFLSRHKHSFFTIEQLSDKIGYNTQDEIADALVLSSYKIFPVRKYLIKDVECFGFDRRYMK